MKRISRSRNRLKKSGVFILLPYQLCKALKPLHFFISRYRTWILYEENTCFNGSHVAPNFREKPENPTVFAIPRTRPEKFPIKFLFSTTFISCFTATPGTGQNFTKAHGQRQAEGNYCTWVGSVYRRSKINLALNRFGC